MNEFLFYGVLFSALVGISILLVIAIFQRQNRMTKFYNYNISYDTNFDKYEKMVKKQKKVVRRKKLYLSYLKLLCKIKGVNV